MVRSVTKYTDDKVFLREQEVKEVSSILLPGIYDFEYDMNRRFNNFVSTDCPKLYPIFPSKEFQCLEDFINIIFSDKYKELCKSSGISNRNGIFLYGEPGIGKSNYINNVLDKALKNHGCCVFNIDSHLDLYTGIEIAKELRLVQDNVFIFLLEEIDQLLSASYEVEGLLKNFMDGINSINNCLFIASTNYKSKIPESLINRPSRFKLVLEIKPTDNVEEIKQWLEATYKIFIPEISKGEIEDLHEMCLNKSIDEIKHIIIDYKMGIKGVTKKD